ncbi:hypothetical protein LXL04_000540 [Taraxacum kok-saghyz]
MGLPLWPLAAGQRRCRPPLAIWKHWSLSDIAFTSTCDVSPQMETEISSFCQFPHIIWLKKMVLTRRYITQILEMESISANQYNEFTVLANIIQVDHGSGWCYASCSKCNKNLDTIDGSFVCSICNQECRYPIIEAFHQTLAVPQRLNCFQPITTPVFLRCCNQFPPRKCAPRHHRDGVHEPRPWPARTPRNPVESTPGSLILIWNSVHIVPCGVKLVNMGQGEPIRVTLKWWIEKVASTCLQHSPLDDIISDQSSTMEYCLIKNLAKENPVGKNFSEGKKSAVYS